MRGGVFASSDAAERRRAAFTLIEILLVVAISLIAAGIAVPALMRTLRGERLRAAARAVATSHRLARATAALRAEEVELRLEPAARRGAVLRRAASPTPAAANTDAPEIPAPNGSASPPPGAAIEAFREWTDDVRLLKIEVEDAAFEDGETRSIRYAPGGRCVNYTAHFEDARGDRAVVRVDAVTGKARMDYERAGR